MTWTPEQREKYNVPLADRTPEQRKRANEALKEKRAAKAIAEGREPRRVGRPPTVTPELRAARNAAKLKKWSERTRAKIKAARAAKALKEGRTPGLVGVRSKLTPEQRRAANVEKSRRCRDKNAAEYRAKQAASAREKRAAIKAGTWVPKARKRLTSAERKAVNIAMSHARRARLKAADGKWNISDLRTMRWRQNGICPICNRQLGEQGLRGEPVAPP